MSTASQTLAELDRRMDILLEQINRADRALEEIWMQREEGVAEAVFGWAGDVEQDGGAAAAVDGAYVDADEYQDGVGGRALQQALRDLLRADELRLADFLIEQFAARDDSSPATRLPHPTTSIWPGSISRRVSWLGSQALRPRRVCPRR